MKKVVNKKDTIYIESILNIKFPMVYFRRFGPSGPPVFMHVHHKKESGDYRCYFRAPFLEAELEYVSGKYSSKSKAIMETLEKVIKEQEVFVINCDNGVVSQLFKNQEDI